MLVLTKKKETASAFVKSWGALSLHKVKLFCKLHSILNSNTLGQSTNFNASGKFLQGILEYKYTFINLLWKIRLVQRGARRTPVLKGHEEVFNQRVSRWIHSAFLSQLISFLKETATVSYRVLSTLLVIFHETDAQQNWKKQSTHDVKRYSQCQEP